MELFLYDHLLAQRGLKLLSPQLAAMAPVDALSSFISANAEMYADAEPALFSYGLLGLRRHFPELFLPPDLTLLAANTLARMEPENIVLLDWTLLPAAMLLSQTGVTFSLPAGASQELEKDLPVAQARRGISAGWNIEGHMDADADLLGRLADGALFFSTWDFLTSVKASANREKLLESGNLERVLMLPKPRRQNCNLYPALLQFGAGRPTIRMGKIDSLSSNPGGLDQGACVAALWDEQGIEVSAQEALCAGKLALPERVQRGTPLRKLADVFRFQVSRRKGDNAKSEDEWFLWSARELALGDLDAETGFAHDDSGSFTIVDMGKAGPRAMRGVLRKNDIVMVFRGSERTLGRVGLFLGEGGHSVPNRAFCIIRARHGVNPVWLYYALRRPEVAAAIKSKGSGADTLIVSMDAIRDLELEIPSQGVVEQVEKMHAALLTQTEIVYSVLGTICMNLEAIDVILSENTDLPKEDMTTNAEGEDQEAGKR